MRNKSLIIGVMIALFLSMATAASGSVDALDAAEALGEDICEGEEGLSQVLVQEGREEDWYEIVFECENGTWGYSGFWCSDCEIA